MLWLLPGGLTAFLVLLIGAGLMVMLVAGSWLAAAARDHRGDNDQTDEEGVGAHQAGLSSGSVPSQYAGLIQQAGSRCATLTPGRLAALLKQESGFNPRASSPAGAQGIAQFMPGTWATHGKDHNNDGKADVWDPADAIPSSADYLCTVAKDVKNVPGNAADNMLAAYNAGPGAVERYGGVPPYEETQNYVQIIRSAEKQFTAEGGKGGGASGAWVAPVADSKVSTGYRVRGGSWSSGHHTGIDFTVPTGTPVRAVSAGTVVTAGWSSSYGYQVVLKHRDGTHSQYAHLSKLSVAAKKQVRSGQQLGVSGSTGNSTGPHLHFEIRTGPGYGTDIDPVTYLRGKGVRL